MTHRLTLDPQALGADHRAGGLRPVCTCGAVAVKNGRTRGGAQAWRCPAVRLTQEHKAAHAAAQARYADTEQGAYTVLRSSLGARIRRTERRIAELEADLTAGSGGAAAPPPAPPTAE